MHKTLLKLFGSCRKNYWVKDYQNMLGLVKTDIGFQLDIVTQLRRLRAHGFALSMLMDKGTINICSDKSRTKPLVKDVCVNQSHWEKYEQYTNREKFIVCITRQYIDIKNREKEVEHIKLRALERLARLNMSPERQTVPANPV